MSAPGVIITQLIVDASGARQGVADFEASMAKAKAAANDAGVAGNTFDSSLQKWTRSLAATDPVLRAQISMQQALERQTNINTQAVRLGIASQDAATDQLDRVRTKYQGYVDKAKEAEIATSDVGKASNYLVGQLEPLIGIFTAMAAFNFAKDRLSDAAALNNLAAQTGLTVEAFQAYRAVLQQSGIDTQEAANLIARLTKNIGDAKDTVGTARTAFHDLGIGYADLASGAEDAIPKIAQHLLNMQDATERARIETELFGKSGQQLEAALHDLIDPTSTLIEKEKALGLVLGEDVTKAANDAQHSLSENWERIKNDLTPAVVELTGALADLIDKYAKWRDLQGTTGQATAAAAGTPSASTGLGYFGGRLNAFVNGAQIGTSSGAAPANNNDFGAGQMQTYLAQQAELARLAGLTATERAAETGAIAASVKQQELQGVAADKVNQTYSYAKQSLDDQTLAHSRNYAITIQQANAAAKLKETFSDYLNQLGQEADDAGKSAAQRLIDVDLIKAANVWQAQNNVLEKDRAKTVDQATAALGAQKTAQVEAAAAAAPLNALEKSIGDQLVLSQVALTASTDQRELALEIAQKQLEVGKTLSDKDKEDLATIQHKNDLVNLGSYMQNLRDEASLAGMSADEREREAAVLQEMHATHGTLTQDQADEIRNIIQARQETEKWQQLTSQITDDFANAFDEIGEKGKDVFGDLISSIGSDFKRMLAQMAAQAIEQPIIIPMIQSLAGSLGLSTGGLGGGASSALGGIGSLSNLSGTGDLFGGIGSSISSGLNSIGTYLGFSPGISTAAGLSGSLGGISTISSPLGSLFGSATLGGTLGGALGGAGLGGLAGSLLFGNKDDSGIGSSIGGAIGSIFGPLGSLAGGLLGGALGSLTGSGNQSSIASFTNGGQGYGITQTGSGQNTQLVTQAAQAINQAITALTQAGVSLNNNITGIGIGSEKDYIYTTGGGKQKLGSAGDPNDVVNQVLTQLLSTASATDSDIQKVIGSYQGQGGITTSNLNQFLSDIGFANTLKGSQDIAQNLTQSEQQINSINSQFQTLIDHASQLGLDTQALVDQRDGADQQVYENVLSILQAMTPANDNADQWKQAMDTIAAAEKEAASAATALGYSLDDVNDAANSARQALAGSFNDQISDAILKLTNPNLEAYNTLIATQTERVKEATEAGADLNSVYQLNTLEQKQLSDAQAEALAQTQQQQLTDSISGLTDNLGALSDQANATAKTAQAAADSWSKANGAISSAQNALLISAPGLSPIDQYNASRSQFGALSAAGLGGDVTSAGNAAGFASQFLQSSFNYNGSTAAYGNDFAYVQSTLNSLSDYTKGQQSAAQAVADQYNQMIALLSALKDAISNNSDINRDGFNTLSAQFEDVADELGQDNLQNRFAVAS